MNYTDRDKPQNDCQAISSNFDAAVSIINSENYHNILCRIYIQYTYLNNMRYYCIGIDNNNNKDCYNILWRTRVGVGCGRVCGDESKI